MNARPTVPALSASELRAIAIALDELRCYHEVMGESADDTEYREGQMHAWVIRKLDALLTRYGVSAR